ncbi:MAG: aminotransferase class I/II-fold pyridoxal phosphate-dependent enzyme [Bacteroidetes bacterium]|nr:aminotransferase class I/II-fold pyridoxal phosphate-dependent enzyme [Bacteroidota bacterium]
MTTATKQYYSDILTSIEEEGLYKKERVITSPQSANIEVLGGQKVLNMCANNYLGLGNHPEIIKAAKESYDKWGYGLSSVRFICGTQKIHKELEKKISEFLEMEDTILYTSCFDANGGLFETILTADDAIISDELNHASIIDGVRLCKAQRFRYKNSDMNDLEEKLKEAKGMRNIIAHEYGKIDDVLVFEAVTEELIPDVKEFLNSVRGIN